MESTLLVTPDELRNTASSFSNKSSEVQTILNDMMTTATALSNSWTGEAGDSYRTKFSALQSSMDTVIRMMTEHVKDLNDMADQYAAAEQAALDAAEGLPACNLD